MGEDEQDAKKRKTLKEELQERTHPPESAAARAPKRALETLISLLDSEDETIRLRAAQAILDRPEAPAPQSAAAGLVKKLTRKG